MVFKFFGECVCFFFVFKLDYMDLKKVELEYKYEIWELLKC